MSLVVPDPHTALQQVARVARARYPDLRLIGVTGSVGKTTTSEAIAAVLQGALPCFASPHTSNEETGIATALLGIEPRHRVAVLELGMSAAGSLARLAALTRPSIAVITMVAQVHLERLGSIEAITATKAELVEALPPDGLAVLNGDDARVRSMAAATRARSVFFGLGADNDWRALDIEDYGLDGLALSLAHGAWSARIETPIVGRHFVYALLAAAAVADALEVPAPRIADLLRQVRVQSRQRLLAGPRERLVIDDTWNASPPSMLAALEVLAHVPRRRVAVLGEMLELGSASEAGHRLVGSQVAGVAQVLVGIGAGGELMAAAARQAGMPAAAVHTRADRGEVQAVLEQVLQPGDAVLVKGSHSLGLDSLVQWLLTTPPGAEVARPASPA